MEKRNRSLILIIAGGIMVIVITMAVVSLKQNEPVDESGTIVSARSEQESETSETATEAISEEKEIKTRKTETSEDTDLTVVSENNNPEVTRAGVSLDDMQESDETSENWKELMRNGIEEKIQEYYEYNQDEELNDRSVYTKRSEFALLYIDDDDIPEVYVMPASGATDGSSILYLNGDSVESYDIGWCDSVSYIQKKGEICLYHGMHVPVQEFIMTFPDEEDLGHGAYAEKGWFDGKDHSTDGSDMEYMWDDEFVSEKEYNAKKDAVFNGDIHVSFEEDCLSYEEIMEYLTEVE